MIRPGRIGLILLLTVATAAGLSTRAEAGALDPTAYGSQGDLVLNAGIYTFNNIPGQFPTLSSYSPTTGQLTTIAGGTFSNGVEVFDFSSITINAGAMIVTPQSLGLNPNNIGVPVAFLSRTFATMNGLIDVSAPNVANNTGTPVGGSGASNLAVGQSGGAASSGSSGQGGAAYSGAGGGGFGGAGGNGQFNGAFNSTGGVTIAPGGLGGSGQFNLANVLQGGSFGGGQGGGGGGGAIELAAVGNLSIGGTIRADGALGQALPLGHPTGGTGGGSGGGIFVYGSTLGITGTLEANGGAGSFGQTSGLSSGGGGGGGGGLILAQYATTGGYSNTGTVNALGGGNGMNGRFDIQVVPEPSSLLMMTLAGCGILGAAVARRHRRA